MRSYIFIQIQGLGAGGMYTMSSVVIADLTTLRERAKYMTYLSLSHTVANGGFVMGSAIVTNTSWRWYVSKTYLGKKIFQ